MSVAHRIQVPGMSRECAKCRNGFRAKRNRPISVLADPTGRLGMHPAFHRGRFEICRARASADVSQIC
jgi:hypothetical protein